MSSQVPPSWMQHMLGWPCCHGRILVWPGYCCPVRLRKRELTSLTTGPASPAYGYFKCKNTLTTYHQPKKLIDYFLECLVWARTVSSPRTRKPQFSFFELLESPLLSLSIWPTGLPSLWMTCHPSAGWRNGYSPATWSSLSTYFNVLAQSPAGL